MKNDKIIVESVLKDFKKRQEERRSFDTIWQMNINFLMGNQYCNVGYGGALEESDKQYFWQEREVFNHIAPIFDIRCAKLSQSKPKFTVLPATSDERDKQTGKVAKKILDSVKYKLKLDDIIDEAIKWSEVTGTVFYKISWNNALGQALATEDDKTIYSGEVSVDVCSPFEIYPDSPTRANLDECQSIIHARAYSVDEIKSMYGVELKGETINCFGLDTVVSGLGGLGYYGTARKMSEDKVQNSRLVIEKYIRPNTDYPNGRLIIVAGDVLVYDDELPYLCGSDGKRDFPFVRQTSLDSPGSFWGGSVVERLVPVQRAYNTIKNRKHEFINRLTLGVLSVEDGSVDIENLEEDGLCPGKVIVYRQGANEPKYLAGESIPAGFADEEEKLLDEFNKISGVSETLGTEYASSNISGAALELMIGQDETRLSSTSDSIKSASIEIAKRILRLYKQFAIFPRLARIVGEKGQIEMFYFSSSDISSDDVVIDVQSDLGDSMSQRREMIFRLLQAGVLYDDEGKLSSRMKGKILEMLGLGVWENAQDLNELHIKSAGNENLKMLDGVVVKTSEIDDDELHVNEHIAFMLGADYAAAKARNPQIEKIFLEHIREHKKSLKTEE